MALTKVPGAEGSRPFPVPEYPGHEGRIRELAQGEFIDAKRNPIPIGGTGTGKTQLAIGIATAVIRARARGRFFNLVGLVNQLEPEKAAMKIGRRGRCRGQMPFDRGSCKRSAARGGNDIAKMCACGFIYDNTEFLLSAISHSG